MGTRAARGALALSVALAAFALPAAAAAQDSVNAPPPERFLVSPGGVDMRSGRYVYNQADLAIGGEAGLSLARSLAQPVAGHANPFANFSHNWDVLISEKRIDIAHNRFTNLIGSPDYQMEVAFGGLSQTFRGFGTYASFDQTSRAGYGALTFTGDRASGTAIFTFTGGDGTQAMFRPIGSADCSTVLRCAYVARITEPDGTRLDFDYDSAGGANSARLRSVVSSRGFALLLEYSGLQVVKACLLNLALAPKPGDNVCPAAAQAIATYTYTSVAGAPRLAGAVDPTGATWGFTYPNANAIGFVRPGESAPWLVNSTATLTDDEGLVTEYVRAQSFADGSSYGYNFDFTPFVPLHASQIAGGSYTDALGNRTTLHYDFPIVPNPHGGHGNVQGSEDNPPPQVYQVTPGPVEITDPLGRVSHVDYCDPAAMAQLEGLSRCVVLPMPVSSTTPTGIRTEYASDMAARNVLQRRQIARPGTGLPDIVTSATFSCTPATFRYCNKPLSTTDARGNTTEFTYSADHGGVLTETGAAPAAGAPRPQTRHLYAQRYAWIANGAGGYVRAATPVWVETATSLCATGAATGDPGAPCALAGDEVRTDYDYGPESGPNNLLLRGTVATATVEGISTTLRTCYGYDALGRRVSETRPNAQRTSCP